MKRVLANVVSFWLRKLTFEIGGIPLRFSFAWFAFVALVAPSQPLIRVAYLFVVMHEYGHAFAARAYGFPCQSITLYPYAGCAAINIPNSLYTAKSEFWIALAGPLVNFGLVILILPVALLFPSSFLVTLMDINLGMSILNLILPLWPLDGGRIFRSLLQQLGITKNYKTATKFCFRVNLVLAPVACWLLWELSPMFAVLILCLSLFCSWAELIDAYREEKVMTATLHSATPVVE